MIRIINEPTAAANSLNRIEKDEIIAVYDFGGGTLTSPPSRW
jgi:molecular chaperone DnaK (HSP70)